MYISMILIYNCYIIITIVNDGDYNNINSWRDRRRRNRYSRINKNTNLTQPNVKRATFVGRAYHPARNRRWSRQEVGRRAVDDCLLLLLRSFLFLSASQPNFWPAQ